MQHITVEQFYLSAEALGITEKERSGLLRFITSAEKGHIRTFDMGSHCGCIGYYAGVPTTTTSSSYGERFTCSAALTPLFYPEQCSGIYWWKATIPQAVQATRNFLTGRGPCWTEVLRSTHAT